MCCLCLQLQWWLGRFYRLLPATLNAAAKKAMKIAGDACIYTNHNQTGFYITKEGEIKEAELS